MGGPSAGVLIPARDEAALLAELEDWLAAMFRPYPPELHLAPIAGYLRLWDGQVLAAEALGPAWDEFVREMSDGDMRQRMEWRPMAMSLARLEALAGEIGPEEVEKLRCALEPTPAYRLQIGAMCNDRIDHRMLGMLALAAASQFGGWIDFNGALGPPLPPVEWAAGRPTWQEPSLEEIRAFLAPFPGRLREIAYEVNEARSWVYHIADAEFLRAWLAHPRFHMIK